MNGNGERRKHDARDCAWGSLIPKIDANLENLVKQVEKDSTHRSKVDDEQFAILRQHEGDIAGLQANVKNLDKRINSKVPAPVVAAASPTANCPEPTLWQAICKIRKVWFLVIFLGGGTFLTFFSALLQALATWLKQFAATLG